MTRLILIAFLMLCGGPASAEWVEATGSKQGDMTVYIDAGSGRREGDLVKIWHLYDFTATQKIVGRLFLSLKTQTEYDCARERMRPLAATYFSGNMGSGTVVHSLPEQSTGEPVQPDSVGLTLWKMACIKQ